MTSVLLAIAVSQSSKAPVWKQFESAAGRYVVEFPGRVREVDETVENVYGKVRYRAAYAAANQTGFHIAFDDHPKPPDAHKFLADRWEKMLAHDMNTKVISRELVTWKGFHAVEGRFYRYVPKERAGVQRDEASFPIARVRMVLVGDRLYQLLVLSRSSKTSPQETDRFFESFRVLDPAR